MADKVTINSSVFVAGLLEFEPRFQDGFKILEKVYNQEFHVIVPTIILPEVIGAVRRRIKDPLKADLIKERLLSLTNFDFIPFNLERAISASGVAVKTGLRGMDAIVVSIAKEFESELITFDKEMEEKAKIVLS